MPLQPSSLIVDACSPSRTMDSENPINGHDLTAPALRPPLIRNSSSKPWIVQKFGGTSVGKFANKIAADIVRPSLKDNRIVVVCSARSTGTKSEGTTTRLIQAAREAENGNSKHYEKIVESIREDHNNTAAQCIRSPSILKTLRIGIQSDCQDLLAFLATVSKPEGIRARSLDVIASKGEILSCHLITALLQDYGVDAEFVDLSNIVPLMSQSQDLNQDFYDNLAFLLHEKIQSCGNKIPVVTGFFGIIPGGLLDQIGRGYTDLCGALISVGLSAEEFQVWKEVDGIFTADPRKVPRASLLATISPAEAAELTFYGSEVIHPATMEQLIKARITIRIKNVMNPRGTGTTISPDPVGYLGSADLSHPSQLSRLKRPTAITIKHKILVLNVHSNKRSLSHGFFAKIFSTLDKWRLSIDLISTSEVHVSMALHSESALTSRDQEDKKRIIDKDLQGAINELRQYGTVDCIDGLAILSLIGKQMKKMVGIAGKMFTILGENKVNIEMISQGASEINISCVIEEKDADRALNILHTNLFTFAE